MEINKFLFIAKEAPIREKNSARELESTLGPMLGFPCSFHVATDNIVAFELTRLQDFQAIIVAQHKTKQQYFDISDLVTILKAVDGCCPPMIFLTDDESQLASPSTIDNSYFVRYCSVKGFVLDDLCDAIQSAVLKVPTTTNESLVTASPTSYTSEGASIAPVDPVNLQPSFAMEVEASQRDYRPSPIPMSLPIVEREAIGGDSAFDGDELDVFLADLCDDSDAMSTTDNCSFMAIDNRKRRYSFDSNSEAEDCGWQAIKKTIKTQPKHELFVEDSSKPQYATILEPDEFEQLMEMFPFQ